MSNANIKQTTLGIRVILYAASFLVLSVSLSLFFFPEQTDVYFSWTIKPPLTAVFLGAGYLASFFFEFLSARERVWANARPAVPGVWLFTLLTLIVTLLHLDRFHFHSPAFITVAGCQTPPDSVPEMFGQSVPGGWHGSWDNERTILGLKGQASPFWRMGPPLLYI